MSEWKQFTFRIKAEELDRLKLEASEKGVALGALIRDRALQEDQEPQQALGDEALLDRVRDAIRHHHYLQWYSPRGEKAAEDVIEHIDNRLRRESPKGGAVE